MKLILYRISSDSEEQQKTYLKIIMWVDWSSGITENLQIEKLIPAISNLSGQFREIRHEH